MEAKRGRKEAVGLEEPQGNPQGNLDDRTEGSCPKKYFPKAEGASELDEDEEELDDEDIEDDDGLEDGFVACDEVENKDVGRPTDDVAARSRAALALEWRGLPPPNLVRPN